MPDAQDRPKTTTIMLSREALTKLREIRDQKIPFNLSAAVSALVVREADRLLTSRAPGRHIASMRLLPAVDQLDPREP